MTLSLSSWATMGSPPRMRGKETYCTLRMISPGITPAYAGKSVASVLLMVTGWDHPRVCGEKRTSPARSLAERGSPPRMRGKVEDPLLDCPKCGITPAYAGKSFGISVGIGVLLDHPRVCGEKALRFLRPRQRQGSPPRMRGKDYEKDLKTKERGITPAYAGKSLLTRNIIKTYRDHPRVCGEKPHIGQRRFLQKGSPPRMRGKAYH